MKYKPYMMKDVIAGEKQNKFKVISTFAGGGGSSTGYRLAGGKILAINEFVEEARNTYRDNYPTTPIMDGDIKELTGKDFLDLTKLKEGELELIIPFSSFVYLVGTQVDYSDDLLNGGFKFTNPQANRTCGCGTSFSV